MNALLYYAILPICGFFTSKPSTVCLCVCAIYVFWWAINVIRQRQSATNTIERSIAYLLSLTQRRVERKPIEASVVARRSFILRILNGRTVLPTVRYLQIICTCGIFTYTIHKGTCVMVGVTTYVLRGICCKSVL